jgi:hypothetical protein
MVGPLPFTLGPQSPFRYFVYRLTQDVAFDP